MSRLMEQVKEIQARAHTCDRCGGEGRLIKTKPFMTEQIKLIYLASPYSHPDPAVRELRYEHACAATAGLMRRGLHVYSPIVHSHPLVKYELPTDWEYWQAHDIAMLHRCQELYVLTLDGWMESKGVRAEIAEASLLELPTVYLPGLPGEEGTNSD